MTGISRLSFDKGDNIGYNTHIDTQSSVVRMVTDEESLQVMQFIANKMGVKIKVSAKEGERYSSRGGEATSVVPHGYCHIIIDVGSAKINDFWEKVRVEKTKRRLIWLAAHPVVQS